MIGTPAAELDAEGWIGEPQSLAALRGRPILIEAFQMLCPACVSHALPQARKVHAAFPEVAVIGLHTVFEHHQAMQRVSLEAFVHEYRIDFPVAIDRHLEGDRIPVTMRRYALQGTPSTLLIDRAGRLRQSSFGTVEDLILGRHLGLLLAEPAPADPTTDHD